MNILNLWTIWTCETFNLEVYVLSCSKHQEIPPKTAYFNICTFWLTFHWNRKILTSYSAQGCYLNASTTNPLGSAHERLLMIGQGFLDKNITYLKAIKYVTFTETIRTDSVLVLYILYLKFLGNMQIFKNLQAYYTVVLNGNH